MVCEYHVTKHVLYISLSLDHQNIEWRTGEEVSNSHRSTLYKYCVLFQDLYFLVCHVILTLRSNNPWHFYPGNEESGDKCIKLFIDSRFLGA